MSFNWNVTQMDCYPQAEGQTDVVFRVSFSVTQSAIVNGLPDLIGVIGAVPVTYTAGSPYTPYNQLTQEQVIGWVQSALGEEGVAEYEAQVAAKVAAAQNPPVVVPPLPWDSPSA